MAETSNPAYRQFRSEVKGALLHLGDSSDEAVHDVRTALKKARADLRLLRDSIGEENFRQENSALRDAGRCFRPPRDARSLMDAFESLRRRYSSELRGVNVVRFRKHLGIKHSEARRALQDAPDGLRDCSEKMKNALRLADGPDYAHARRKALVAGLKHIYGQGRKALAEGEPSCSADALHEWRKQVKYLLNAGQCMHYGNGNGRHEPKVLKRANRLAHELGDIHDLAMLDAEITNADQGVMTDGAKEKLQALISHRISALQKRAFRLGGKLYRRKSKRFTSRLT